MQIVRVIGFDTPGAFHQVIFWQFPRVPQRERGLPCTLSEALGQQLAMMGCVGWCPVASLSTAWDSRVLSTYVLWIEGNDSKGSCVLQIGISEHCRSLP